MNLQDLRYLVALAEHRHFGRAAEACFVSQPTLSTQLRKLEKELGVELVERNPRRVMLTDIGTQIADRARTVIREADGIGELARQARDPATGSLRIGLFPTLGPYVLPHVVPSLHRTFPDLELLLVEEKTESVLHRLRDGSLDVGVLAMPVHDESLHEEPLFEEDFVLAVPADHPAADHPRPVDTSILDGESVLLLDDGHCLRDQALSVCSLAGATERSGFRATSLETLRQMVAAGVGVTLLPRLAVSPPVAASPDVHIVEFTAPRPARRIAMYWRRSSPFRAFLPQVADHFRGLPGELVSRLSV
ncbi:MAG: DNA-binding transcriptional regulator OxyR [Ilumatobacteraceae bacterium]